MTPARFVYEIRAGLARRAGRIRPRWYGIGVGILVVSVFTLITGTFWALITTLGLVAVVVGIVAAVRGSAGFFRVRSKYAGRALLIAGVLVVLVGTAADSLTTPQIEPVASSATASGAGDGFVRRAAPDPTPRPTRTATPTPTPTPTPVETESEVSESAVIPFAITSVDDAGVDVGTTTVTSVGQPGTRTTTYLVHYVDGVEVSRAVSAEAITLAPVAEVTTIGTRQPAPVAVAPAPAPAAASGCDPNYTGACVPIASDVDCAGGSGNGPAYVAGPVRVVGSDIYDLDRDGDGIACD